MDITLKVKLLIKNKNNEYRTTISNNIDYHAHLKYRGIEFFFEVGQKNRVGSLLDEVFKNCTETASFTNSK